MTRVDHQLKIKYPLKQHTILKPIITLAISKWYGKVRVLFSARQLFDFTRQLARFTRSWSSGKMLAFQPRCFVFEPVGMRLSIPKQKVLTFFGTLTLFGFVRLFSGFVRLFFGFVRLFFEVF